MNGDVRRPKRGPEVVRIVTHPQRSLLSLAEEMAHRGPIVGSGRNSVIPLTHGIKSDPAL